MSIINIFVSHRWTQDDKEYEKLEDWLRSDSYYTFKFYSVSASDFALGVGIESYLKKSIRDRIDKSSVFVSFNNQSSSYSDSIHKYEIEYAKEKGYPIVLINKHGMSQTPSIFKHYDNLHQCNWNSASIREVIKKAKK